MSYYTQHVFFFTYQSDAGRDCCNNYGASELLAYAKDRLRELPLAEGQRVRVQKAGCLERCDFGPVLVIYPEAVWYTFIDCEDVDEILSEHVLNGRIVERLRIADHA